MSERDRLASTVCRLRDEGVMIHELTLCRPRFDALEAELDACGAIVRLGNGDLSVTVPQGNAGWPGLPNGSCHNVAVRRGAALGKAMGGEPE
jgi:hypothetical protein